MLAFTERSSTTTPETMKTGLNILAASFFGCAISMAIFLVLLLLMALESMIWAAPVVVRENGEYVLYTACFFGIIVGLYLYRDSLGVFGEPRGDEGVHPIGFVLGPIGTGVGIPAWFGSIHEPGTPIKATMGFAVIAAAVALIVAVLTACRE